MHDHGMETRVYLISNSVFWRRNSVMCVLCVCMLSVCLSVCLSVYDYSMCVCLSVYCYSVCVCVCVCVCMLTAQRNKVINQGKFKLHWWVTREADT